MSAKETLLKRIIQLDCQLSKQHVNEAEWNQYTDNILSKDAPFWNTLSEEQLSDVIRFAEYLLAKQVE